jgi:hypothetical protein
VKIREKLEQEISNEFIIYSEKLDKIEKLLKDLVQDKVQFIGDNNYYKIIDDVSTCIVKEPDECKKDNLCAMTDEDCNLILPEKNLMTNKNNETIYFGKMADELVRYSRIKTFMFQPQTYLSFGNVSYQLNEDEIIMLQSLLTQEYFENLIPSVINKYVKNNSYDEVIPIISQTYENKVESLDKIIGIKNKNPCNKEIKKKITNALWSKCFPENYKEIIYGRSNSCSFQIIIDIIENTRGEIKTVNEIKSELFQEYQKYLNPFQNKIIDILIIEGKKTLGNQVNAETLSFTNFIYTDNYFLTTLDLWILIQKYEIPTIFISPQTILQTNFEKRLFVGYGNDIDEKYVFISLSGFKVETVPQLKLITDENTNILISIKEVKEDCLDEIREAFEDKINIIDYFKKFIKPKIYQKRKIPREDNLDIIEEPEVTENVFIEAKEPEKEVMLEEPMSEEKASNIEEPMLEKPKVKKLVKKTKMIESLFSEEVPLNTKNRTKRTKRLKVVLKGRSTKKNSDTP